MKQNPRFDILRQIKDGETEKLLLAAGQLHGHYCPGLALGVLAAEKAMMQIKALSDGMEDLLAIVETNNCFADGVQFVTGCSFGNNALIFKDFGKMAVTLTSRNGKSLRIVAKNNALERVKTRVPEFEPLFKKVVEDQSRDEKLMKAFKEVSAQCSFETIKMPVNDLFSIAAVEVSIPAYAPIMETLLCDRCGEAFVASKAAPLDSETLCRSCATAGYGQLDGNGINEK